MVVLFWALLGLFYLKNLLILGWILLVFYALGPFFELKRVPLLLVYKAPDIDILFILDDTPFLEFASILPTPP